MCPDDTAVHVLGHQHKHLLSKVRYIRKMVFLHFTTFHGSLIFFLALPQWTFGLLFHNIISWRNHHIGKETAKFCLGGPSVIELTGYRLKMQLNLDFFPETCLGRFMWVSATLSISLTVHTASIPFLHLASLNSTNCQHMNLCTDQFLYARQSRRHI